MIPFFIYYSMFGFQRIGDLIWAAGDMRCRGFLLGGTAGRTTLAGEGLQHQDGNSHLNALAFPTVLAYDPCFAYELSAIVLDGIRKMYFEDQDVFYYITLMNENYEMPAMPHGLDRRHLPGHLPAFAAASCRRKVAARAAFRQRRHPPRDAAGTGPAGAEVRRLQQRLQRDQLQEPLLRRPRMRPLEPAASRRVAAAAVRRADPRRRAGPIVAASDYVAAVPQAIAPWVGPDYTVLGTDGFGRSEAREELRRFFEVDAENIALAALEQLARRGELPKAQAFRRRRHAGLGPGEAESGAAVERLAVMWSLLGCGTFGSKIELNEIAYRGFDLNAD